MRAERFFGVHKKALDSAMLVPVSTVATAVSRGIIARAVTGMAPEEHLDEPENNVVHQTPSRISAA